MVDKIKEKTMSEDELKLLDIASRIVVAHLQTTPESTEKLPELINETIGALKSSLDANTGNSAGGHLYAYAKYPHAGRLSPAVPVEDSVHDDYLVCLEDGKKLKMLKRHLKAAFNMTMDDYIQKWGLPRNYPAVAPNYQERRRHLARYNGFGYGIKRSPPNRGTPGYVAVR